MKILRPPPKIQGKISIGQLNQTLEKHHKSLPEVCFIIIYCTEVKCGWVLYILCLNVVCHQPSLFGSLPTISSPRVESAMLDHPLLGAWYWKNWCHDRQAPYNPISPSQCAILEQKSHNPKLRNDFSKVH